MFVGYLNTNSFFTAQKTCYEHGSALALKNPDIVEVRKDLFEDSSHMKERLCAGSCVYLFLRAAHRDTIVGSVVIGQVALENVRDGADNTISGRIVLT